MKSPKKGTYHPRRGPLTKDQKALVAEHFPHVLQVVKKYCKTGFLGTRSGDEEYSFACEVLCRAARSYAPVGSASFKNYLYIAVRRAISFEKKKIASKRIQAVAFSIAGIEPDEDYEPLDQSYEEPFYDEYRPLYDAIGSLSPTRQQIVRDHFLGGKSARAIRDSMGLDPGRFEREMNEALAQIKLAIGRDSTDSPEAPAFVDERRIERSEGSERSRDRYAAQCLSTSPSPEQFRGWMNMNVIKSSGSVYLAPPGISAFSEDEETIIAAVGRAGAISAMGLHKASGRSFNISKPLVTNLKKRGVLTWAKHGFSLSDRMKEVVALDAREFEALAASGDPAAAAVRAGADAAETAQTGGHS